MTTFLLSLLVLAFLVSVLVLLLPIFKPLLRR